MVAWKIVYTNQAKKDAKKLKQNNLKAKAQDALKALQKNPFEQPYEKLVGDLKGAYSKRINIHHRLVYQVFKKEKTIKVIRMWTHYE